jgi:hypothetical protein
MLVFNFVKMPIAGFDLKWHETVILFLSQDIAGAALMGAALSNKPTPYFTLFYALSNPRYIV